MKKSMYLMGVAALATLASCSQEDLINVAENNAADGITFRARTFRATRGNDITTENLQSFKVFGMRGDINDYRDGVEGATMKEWLGDAIEFRKSDVPFDQHETFGQYFRSETPVYYPTDYSFVTFLAYAPSTLTGVDKVLTGLPQHIGNLKITNFTVKDDLNEQDDIIVDGTPGARDDSYASVDLTFNHALSKVYVSKAMNNDTQHKYKVAGVRFGNIAKSGDYMYNPYDLNADDADMIPGTGATHNWAVDANSIGNVEYIFDEGIEIGSEQTTLMSGGYQPGETDGSFLLIPQQLEYAVEEGNNSDPVKLLAQEGVAYIGLLIRITRTDGAGEEEVVYPFKQGVSNITKTVDGEQYAWAMFPISTKWIAGCYVDYMVDFSKGAGYVAPGAEGFNRVFVEPSGEEGDEDYDEGISEFVELEYTPILGEQLIFTVEINGWDNNGYEGTVTQEGEVGVDIGGGNDAFGDLTD